MERGVIHGVDKKRVYIRATQNPACTTCHAKHLCLQSRGRNRIIPVKKKKEHASLKKGDKIAFEINPFQSTKATSFFYGLPIVGIIAGFGVGNIITTDEIGIFLITVIVTIIAFDIQYIVKKKYNFFKEIKVEIKQLLATK